MDYKIAIPSFRRSRTIFGDTLKTLLESGAKLADVTVFVSDANEYDEYVKEVGEFVMVVKGKLGIANNRNAILDYYPKCTKIIMCDDDLDSIKVLKNSKLIPGNINRIAEDGFSTCLKHDASLFAVYPVSNPFFMKQRKTKGLFLAVGCFVGIINNKQDYLYVNQDEKEDYLRSFQVYDNEGGVIRLEYVTIDTPYYTKYGGLQETRTPENMDIATKAVQAKYPHYCKYYIRKTSGRPELRLNNAKYKTQVIG